MKLSAPHWKLLKYLFWLSPVLITAGLVVGLIGGSWGAVPLGLILAGVVILGWWLMSSGQSGRLLSERSAQVGTNALLSTLAVLAILGMVNLLAVRYSSRIDLTETRIFTLAPQTQQVVQTLKQPVKVWVFDSAPNPADRDLLDNYQRQNRQLTYEFVDPQAKPGIAQRLGVKSIGEVVLESGTARRVVQSVNQQQRLSERQLTSGLVKITDARQQKVYFVQGHGERRLEEGKDGMSQAIARLNEENFTHAPLNLIEAGKIPDDAAAVVLAGSERSLLEKEITILEDYLKRRSGLMLLIDPETDPKVGKLLEAWGVKLSDRIVVDPAGQASGLGAGVTIINQYGDHPISKGLGDGISFYPLARPLATTTISGVETVPFLFTSDRTQAQKLDQETGGVKADPADPKPPYAIGVAFSRLATAGVEAAGTNAKPQSRLVVIGNSRFATDGLFEQQLNGDIFLNAISWLSQGDDQVLAIRPREMQNRRIVMGLEQQVSVALIAMVLLPVLGFGTGAVIWWRRR
jgi:ABC-type uncharacterized transport system involved in gliding motility auxiliary subunit